MKKILSDQFPTVSIRGFFIARRVFSNPFAELKLPRRVRRPDSARTLIPVSNMRPDAVRCGSRRFAHAGKGKRRFIRMPEYEQVTVGLLPKQRRFLEREAAREDRTIS